MAWRVLRDILCGLLVAAAPSKSLEQDGGASLDLDVFEDDDCREAEGAEILLMMMHDMCDLLDRVLLMPGERSGAWADFEAWQQLHVNAMVQMAGNIFWRPYCEPGKVAWMAAECLLVLRSGADGAEDALKCAEGLDEDFLAQITPRGTRFQTRLHLMLRSVWPAFRLLDLFVRLHPETGTTRMGACHSFQNWQTDPDIFDWQWFKPLVISTANAVALSQDIDELRSEDGPLSVQYQTRWSRIYSGLPGMRESMLFADDVFEKYREHHYKAGCHLGVITSYVLQVLLVHLRDVEGHLHRYTASVAQLINLHAPFPHAVRSDWPVFGLLHLTSLMQRVPPREVWESGATSPNDKVEPRARQKAAQVLVSEVEASVVAQNRKTQESVRDVALVTAAWGTLSRFAGRVLARLARLAPEATAVVFVALDAEALQQCKRAKEEEEEEEKLSCIDSPRRLGVEGAIAKYLALAAIAKLGMTVAWLDLDVYVTRDPIPRIRAALAAESQPDLVFGKHHTSESVSPAILIARGSAEAVDLLMRYASWLRENPYLFEHRGWDQFLDNRFGDHAGGFDYQGRNVTVKDDGGPKFSFPPTTGMAPPLTRYTSLGDEFGSGDGWQGDAAGNSLVFFHFWGCNEAQDRLFEVFYPFQQPGFAGEALRMAAQYRRVVVSAPSVSALVGSEGTLGGDGPLYFVSISYADGCCKESIKKNRRQALAVGVDEARAYGRADLGPEWAGKHQAVLSQRRGAGWWLWKPYVILKTLRDPALPWGRGVVIWHDAGNYFHADPRPLITNALRKSDVAAMRLKWCLEVDWTSAVTLERMNVSGRYAVTHSPQMGAYFLVFRKTKLSIAFVEKWLKLSEDPETLLGAAARRESDKVEGEGTEEVPGFQKHQADQSIFSVLFKEHGFHAMSLEEGHRVLTLARWRQ